MRHGDRRCPCPSSARISGRRRKMYARTAEHVTPRASCSSITGSGPARRGAAAYQARPGPPAGFPPVAAFDPGAGSGADAARAEPAAPAAAPAPSRPSRGPPRTRPAEPCRTAPRPGRRGGPPRTASVLRTPDGVDDPAARRHSPAACRAGPVMPPPPDRRWYGLSPHRRRRALRSSWRRIARRLQRIMA